MTYTIETSAFGGSVLPADCTFHLISMDDRPDLGIYLQARDGVSTVIEVFRFVIPGGIKRYSTTLL